MKELAKRVANHASGEFLVKDKNSGTVIVARAALVAAELLAAWLVLQNWLDPDKAHLSFNLDVLRRQLVEKLPALGAIWAAVYLALYARFASQWSYLAGLYNKVLELEAAGTTEAAGTATVDPLRKLKHAFIVDAEELHMLGKDLFRHPARRWLLEKDVKAWFVEKNSEKAYESTLKLVQVEP